VGCQSLSSCETGVGYDLTWGDTMPLSKYEGKDNRPMTDLRSLQKVRVPPPNPPCRSKREESGASPENGVLCRVTCRVFCQLEIQEEVFLGT